MAVKLLCTDSGLNCGKGKMYEIRGTVGRGTV
nr:MAG TPA: Halocidin family [Caudoviricetes sp.]DAO51615.1 MAG TPA: Halocidin family [Caudoviricetes sp.]